ncbi:probable xyloglucan glycosyltransferase 12 [Elaeis guineensis]|uniref:probable xyloglucan glycosyltransferase 12 n=1 Tax=Elaeis guineensis var. tenera TaxID=51953 RepID=UPI003C6CD284
MARDPRWRRTADSGPAERRRCSRRRRSAVQTSTQHKVFLWLSGVKVVAYFKGWHLRAPQLRGFAFRTSFGVRDLFDSVYSWRIHFRVEYVAPPLQFLVDACVVLFLIQSTDRLILCLGCFWIHFQRIKPVPKTAKPRAGAFEDLESGGEDFPMVLVLIPMCNEREVYQQLIAAVCNLNWPRSNLLVQVLDDSDDPMMQALIKEEVEKKQQNGAQMFTSTG